MKLSESIDLLLAAGYFRARIKVLSAFDKASVGVATFYHIELGVLLV